MAKGFIMTRILKLMTGSALLAGKLLVGSTR
jgi:hypothetical protein